MTYPREWSSRARRDADALDEMFEEITFLLDCCDELLGLPADEALTPAT